DLVCVYRSRALRLLPALVALIMFAFVFEKLYPVCPSSFPSIEHRILYVLGYYSNWVWAFGSQLNKLCSFYVMWSLAIEEQFYLVWPFILIWLLKRLSYHSLAFLLGGCVLCVVALRLYLGFTGAPYWRVYAGTDTHADPILLGAMLAVGAIAVPQSYWTELRTFFLWCGPLAFVGLLVLMMRLSFPSSGFADIQFTVVGLLTVVLIVTLTVSPSPVLVKIFECRPLVWMGQLSYGIYLWHSLVDFYLRAQFGVACPTLARILAGVGLAALSYYLVERPFLRMKARTSGLLRASLNPS